MCFVPRSVNWNNHIPWSQVRSSQQQRAAAPSPCWPAWGWMCCWEQQSSIRSEPCVCIHNSAGSRLPRVIPSLWHGGSSGLGAGNLGFNKGKSFALLWCICQHLAEPWSSSAGLGVKGKQRMSADGFVRARGLSDLILPDIG